MKITRSELDFLYKILNSMQGQDGEGYESIGLSENDFNKAVSVITKLKTANSQQPKPNS